MATALWGVRVTQRMLVEATGISLKMIQALARPMWTQSVQTRLPDALSGERIADITRATGRQWDTIAAIRDGESVRVKRATLAAICDAAHQQGTIPVSVGAVLVYSGPKPWETTRVS